MGRRIFNKFRISNRCLIFILVIIIGFHFCVSSCNKTIEGLENNNIVNNVLLGVGANYQLSTYAGTTWTQLHNPPGLTKPFLLAVALGPDGNLYAVANDFRLYKAKGGGWEKPNQPTSLQFLSIANENNQLVGVGVDYKLYVYDPPTGTVNPFPGETGPVISVLRFKDTDFGVKNDHKLYKWINNKWVLYDGNAPTKDVGLINIAEYNGKMYGVGTDQKMYMYEGTPGEWTLAAGNKGIKLLSIYSITHDDYLKFGFS